MLHVLDKFRYCPVCGSSHFEEQDEKSKLCKACGFEYYLNPSAAVAAFILNERGELLVTTRKKEPGKGTCDLPGGFCDIGETIYEALCREVKEETNLEISDVEFFCSLPNKYRYSGFDVPTLDSFFVCKVADTSVLSVSDDVSAARWLPLDEVHTEEFGLRSIRQALFDFLQRR
ncbi:NUDIX domain-containing protein [Prevotella dentasini]|uniref:NUDIX domain-containing protein n=1 Tax=Prevotella dentasini TaxID=589537 RepID=UPI0004685C4B|nr:NUDIX domain-containing protein [Prevotella dentasini]